MICLNVGLEDVADRTTSALSEVQILVDVVNVRVAHGELALTLSTEEVGGAARLRVQNLAKDHGAPALAMYASFLSRPRSDRTLRFVAYASAQIVPALRQRWF